MADHRFTPLICPFLDPADQVGPLVHYAITPEFIFTRHQGSKLNEWNPRMRVGDPGVSFFFRVARSDGNVVGPIPQTPWEADYLPHLKGLKWEKPRNPNFWRPFLGSAMFVGFMVLPVLLVLLPVLSIVLVLRYYRRQRRKISA